MREKVALDFISDAEMTKEAFLAQGITKGVNWLGNLFARQGTNMARQGLQAQRAARPVVAQNPVAANVTKGGKVTNPKQLSAGGVGNQVVDASGPGATRVMAGQHMAGAGAGLNRLAGRMGNSKAFNTTVNSAGLLGAGAAGASMMGGGGGGYDQGQYGGPRGQWGY